jgi:oligopeptide/dipeptide ABC transporter ATP-binding protein
MRPTPTPADAPVGPAAVDGPLLAVRGLKVHFHLDEGVVRAVDGVSFDVHPGQVLGIVGESGCGKSVTMRAVLQIVDPPGRIVAGEILFRGGSRRPGETMAPEGGAPAAPTGDGAVVDLARLPPRGPAMRAIRGAEIALIPQEPMAAFSPVHTVGAQIVEAILLHQKEWRPEGPRVTRGEARRMTVELFRDVGIAMPQERIDAYSWQLSGGLRQRAMIAMALSCKPRLLIADEPTTAIDVTTQAQILNLLRELQRKYRTAIVFITHDLGVIAQMAQQVVVMYLGRVAEQGPVDEIFHAPKHPYTRALLRSIPSLTAAPGVALPTIQGSIPHPFARPSGCPFHPRCAEVLPDVCARRIPSLQAVGPHQTASCFLYHDVEEPE